MLNIAFFTATTEEIRLLLSPVKLIDEIVEVGFCAVCFIHYMFMFVYIF